MYISVFVIGIVLPLPLSHTYSSHYDGIQFGYLFFNDFLLLFRSYFFLLHRVCRVPYIRLGLAIVSKVNCYTTSPQ